MNIIHNICNVCRICKNIKLTDIIDLKEQIITSRFPLYGDFSTPSTPIVLSLCSNCSLVQLKYSNNIKTKPVGAIPVIPKKAPVVKPKIISIIY